MNQPANCLNASSMFLRYAFIFVHCAYVSNENSKRASECSTLLGVFTNMFQYTLCLGINVQFETQTAQTCIFMAGPLFSIALASSLTSPPLTPSSTFVFLEADLSRDPWIFVGPSLWSKMTWAADIQWLCGFITDVYSVPLCWSLFLLKGVLPRAAQMALPQAEDRAAPLSSA